MSCAALSISALWDHRWLLERRSGRVRRLARLRFGRYQMESGHGARIGRIDPTRTLCSLDCMQANGRTFRPSRGSTKQNGFLRKEAKNDRTAN